MTNTLLSGSGESAPAKSGSFLRPRGLAPVACSLLGALAVAPLGAQTSAQAEVIELDEVVVTGSFIPTAADAVAVPVSILGPRELVRTGIDNNLLEILRKQLPMFAGNGNLGNTNGNVGIGNTAGGSQISLRNLDTLVLINGRRISNSGIGGRGGRNFVDVNLIPAGAIQSIEILTDGASATYGSDAIGGVVNIKLRDNFEGVEAGARFAMASGDGDYTERSFYAIAGAKVGGVNVTLSANLGETDPLFQEDRAFSTPILGRTATISGAIGQGTSFPTHFLNPTLRSPSQTNPTGTAATATSLAALVANGTYQTGTFASIANTFDLSPYVTLLIGQQRRSASAAFSYDLTESIELFGDLMYTSNDSISQLAAQPTTPNITLPAGAPFNPLTVDFPQIAFRYTPAPRIFENEAKLIRYAGGLRGRISEHWNWEVATAQSRNDLVAYTKNVLYAPNVNRAVAGGFNAAGVATPGGAFSRVETGFASTGNFVISPALDPLARPEGVNPLSLEHVLGRSRSDFDSKLASYDARLVGELFELPGGKVGGAVGAEYRLEELSGMPDDNSRNTGPTARRWLGATFFDPFSRDRDVNAAFAEVRVPITQASQDIPLLTALDVSAAIRWEDYSDAGESTVPKFGVRWQPFGKELTLRSTYSEGFSAPSLFALYGPQTQGFTATNVIPNVFGVNGQAQSRTGSNPNLRPSNAESMSFGLVYSPSAVKNLTVTLDYIEVDQTDIVSTIGVTTILQDVNLRGAASPYASQVSLFNFAGEAGAQAITTAGQLQTWLNAGNSANTIYVFDGNVNVAGQKVEAFDLTLDYVLPTDLGEFDFRLVSSFFLSYQFQTRPDQPFYEYAGTATNGGTGAQGTIPDYSLYGTVDWSKGPWSVIAGVRHVPSVDDIGPGGSTFATSTTLTRRKVESYTTFDLAASYRFSPESSFLKGFKVTVGVNNIANEMPPLAAQAFNESNVDLSTYSAIGRLMYISGSIAF